MMKIATAKEMQQIDRTTIDKYGVAGIVLMERAGLSVVSRINELLFDSRDREIVILCGSGNNGGDGLVIARILHNQGNNVNAFLSGKSNNLKGDAATNYKAAKKFGVRIYPLKSFLNRQPSTVNRHSLIIDALLGTGLSKEVRAPLSDLIRKVNSMSSKVLSVDIPSGISSDTGQAMGIAVRADLTVTFGLPKRGHLLYPGAEYSGKLYVEDIGFPAKLLKSEKIRVNAVEESDLKKLIPSRPKNSHKGTYGHVLLVAGSRGKTGAALMAARACLKSGAGLVTIGTPETLVDLLQSRVTEEMILPLPDKGDGTLSVNALERIFIFLKKRGNVLAIGPGLSVDKEISDLVALLIAGAKVPVILDADGLNAIAGGTSVLKKAKVPVILTPHPGEMARLLRRGAEHRAMSDDRQSQSRDRITTALSFAKRTKTFLVLKGVPTVTATPGGSAFLNPTGNPGMASAGTGDLLTGMIASFVAQGLPPEDASVLAVYMHGYAGDLAVQKKGERSLTASDIIRAIPAAFKSIEKWKS